jgi:hypothetical protein
MARIVASPKCCRGGSAQGELVVQRLTCVAAP